MAYLWYRFNYVTGVVDENHLPVIRDTDKFGTDIHGEYEFELSISKRNLPNPANWKTFLNRGDRGVALIDKTLAYNDPNAVLQAGVIIRAVGKVKDVITLKAVGQKEYNARRAVTTIASGTEDNPNAKTDFKGDSFRSAIIQACQHPYILPGGWGGKPAPGVTTGSSFPSASGGTLGISVKNSDNMMVRDAIEELQGTGPGNEIRYPWVWTNSSMTNIAFELEVAPDNAPHIREDQTVYVTLDDPSTKLLAFTETSELDGFGNRIIFQSKAGDEAKSTGSDYYVKPVNSGEVGVLYDLFFNPGVELTTAERDVQLDARLQYSQLLQGTAEMEVAGSYVYWINQLGKKLNITGGTNIDSSGYDITVRICKVEATISTNKVKITVMPLQAKYPKLPKAGKIIQNGGNKKGGMNSGGNKDGFKYTGPIKTRSQGNFPGYPGNGSGSGGGGTPPGPEIPDFEIPDPYEDKATNVWKNTDTGTKTVTDQPMSGEASFHYKEKLYSLSVVGQMHDWKGSPIGSNSGGWLDPNDINVYVTNLSGATNVGSISDPVLIGTLPATMYQAELTHLIYEKGVYYNFTHSAVAVLNNRVYIFLTSVASNIFFNTGANKREKTTRSRSSIFSAPLSGDSLGEWREEAVTLEVPGDSDYIFAFTSKSIVPVGDSNQHLGVFSVTVLPKDGTEELNGLNANGFSYEKRNVGWTVRFPGGVSEGNGAPFVSTGPYNDEFSTIIAGYNDTATNFVLANGNNKTSNSIQIFQGSAKQTGPFSYTQVIQSKGKNLPSDRTIYSGLIVLKNWIILNEIGNSTYYDVFRAKLNVTGQVIKNTQSPKYLGQDQDSQSYDYFMFWGNFFTLESGKAQICINHWVPAFDAPLSNGFMVINSGGYNNINFSTAEINV